MNGEDDDDTFTLLEATEMLDLTPAKTQPPSSSSDSQANPLPFMSTPLNPLHERILPADLPEESMVLPPSLPREGISASALFKDSSRALPEDFANSFSKFLSSSVLPFPADLLQNPSQSTAAASQSSRDVQRQRRRKEEFDKSLQQLSRHVQRVVHTPSAEEQIGLLKRRVAELEGAQGASQQRYDALFLQYQEQRQQNASLLLEVARLSEDASRARVESLAGSGSFSSTFRRLSFDQTGHLAEEGSSDSDVESGSEDNLSAKRKVKSSSSIATLDSQSSTTTTTSSSSTSTSTSTTIPIDSSTPFDVKSTTTTTPPPTTMDRSDLPLDDENNAHDDSLSGESSTHDLLQTSHDLEGLIQQYSDKILELEQLGQMQAQMAHNQSLQHAQMLKTAQDDSEALRAEIQSLNASKSSLEATLLQSEAQLLLQIEELQEQLQLKEDFAETLVKELANVKIAVRSDQQRAAQLEGQLGGWQLRYDQLCKSAELLQNEVSTLTREKEARDALVRSQDDELLYQKGASNRVQQELGECLRRVASLEQALGAANKKVERLEQERQQSSAYRQHVSTITSRLKSQISKATGATPSFSADFSMLGGSSPSPFSAADASSLFASSSLSTYPTPLQSSLPDASLLPRPIESTLPLSRHPASRALSQSFSDHLPSSSSSTLPRQSRKLPPNKGHSSSGGIRISPETIAAVKKSVAALQEQNK